MRFKRILRCSCVAGTFAALGVLFGAIGAFAALAAGLIGLIVIARKNTSKDSGFGEYAWLMWCSLSFIVVTLVLSPMADLPAVWIALCLLSPLFGTASYVAERAIHAIRA